MIDALPDQGRIPTTQISDGRGGYLIINASEFDPSKHVVFEQDGTRTITGGDDGRDELLERAVKVGLKVDRRWSLETLQQKVEEAE